MKRRTQDVYELGKWLKRVVQGHNNYYAAPENSAALNQFRTEIVALGLEHCEEGDNATQSIGSV
jgi:hypothetical protein